MKVRRLSETLCRRTPRPAGRYASALLGLLLLVSFSACDSGGGDRNNLDGVDGTYVATRLYFNANGTDDFDVDLIENLGRAPRLEIVGTDRFFLLRYGNRSLRGDVTRRRSRLRFDVSNGTPGDLLLPRSESGTDFSLGIQGEAEGDFVLEETIPLQDVDLRAYGVNQDNVDGTLQIRFVQE